MWSKTALLLSAYFALGVASCPRKLPEPPRLIWGQCSINWPKGGRPALYCIDPYTGKCKESANGGCLIVPIDSQYAKGAQVLLPQDYNAMSAWWDQVINLAQTRCK
jgi:hypothetical protein